MQLQQTIDKVSVVVFVFFDILTEFKMAFKKTVCVFLFLQVLIGARHRQAEGNKSMGNFKFLFQYSDETAKKSNRSQTFLQ